MADHTSSSQEELEEASEGQMPEVHSANAFNTALSNRASRKHLCKHLHHAKWLALSSAPKGRGKMGWVPGSSCHKHRLRMGRSAAYCCRIMSVA